MANELVNLDGEILTPDTNAIGTLVSAEIHQQIATARAFPRDLRQVGREIMDMATMSEQGAAMMTYLLKRKSKQKDADGKTIETRIEGPSIRFAEIVQQAYGNYRAASRIIATDTKAGVIVAEGVFFDLQKNGAVLKTHTRSIKGKFGIFSADMISVTGNAASSIALRNAILGGVPRALWLPAWEASQEVLRGSEQNRIKGVENMFKAFASAHGVSAERILAWLDVRSPDDISLDQLADLRATFATLKNGEARVDEVFATGGSEHEVVENALADEDGPKVRDKLRNAEEYEAQAAATAKTTAKGGKGGGKKTAQQKAAAPEPEPEPEREPGEDEDDFNGDIIEE